MNEIFNANNPVFVAISKISDMLLLSMLWVVLCIPIITIGPATTALYYATVKSFRRERGYIFREFFKSFRANFKTGAIVGLIQTIILVVLSLDVWMSHSSLTSNVTVNSILNGVYLAVILFVLCVSIYLYPILSRFNMNVKQLFKAAVYMSLRHLLRTIVMLFLLLATILSVIFLKIVIIIVPVLFTWLMSFIMEKILIKYIPHSENKSEDGVKDEWYLE